MRDNRARRKEQRVIVDGFRETRRAIERGLRPLGVYVTADGMRETHRGDAQAVLAAAGETLIEVTPSIMQKISYGQSPRGVVAEFESPRWELEQLELGPCPLVLVLDRLEKPGNVGAAFRSADAAGVDAVILTPAESDRFNPNAIRSSLGAVFSVPSATATESEARSWMVQRGIQILAARVESSEPIWKADLTVPTAIVVGSEADGLDARWQTGDAGTVAGVHIPMSGAVDSLNASVSAAVLLFEAARQRRG